MQITLNTKIFTGLCFFLILTSCGSKSNGGTSGPGPSSADSSTIISNFQLCDSNQNCSDIISAPTSPINIIMPTQSTGHLKATLSIPSSAKIFINGTTTDPTETFNDYYSKGQIYSVTGGSGNASGSGNGSGSGSYDRVELGMGNIPVLDQGASGTCSTFASTAFLSAELGYNENTMISPLCILQASRDPSSGYCDLIDGKDQNCYNNGGAWAGNNNGSTILSLISNIGYLSMAEQKINKCGTSDGEFHGAEEGDAISHTGFHSLKFTQYNVVDPSQMWGENKIIETKKQLKQGHRILIGTLIYTDPDNSKIQYIDGYYNNKEAGWALTPKIYARLQAQDKRYDGHEMIVTGYDDGACITAKDEKSGKYFCPTYIDNNGKQQEDRGVLTLRNSWGEGQGDNGNYYMSYEYYRYFVYEAIYIN